MIILGIDPGSARIGFGVISKDKEIKLIDCGVIEHTNTPQSGAARIKLENSIPYVAKRISNLIKKYQPELVGIEKIYFAKNVKTGIEVAQTRGAIILEIAKLGIPIKEFGPSEIKSAITGYGFADKKAVAKMAAAILGVKEGLKGYDDASDAVAIAIATAFTKEYK